MTTPPATCDSQPCLLMIRPQSCTATTLVQRTTPVSVSTRTSAICTPPTPTFDSPAVQSPLPSITSMPSRAQASFHDQLLLFALSTTLPCLIGPLPGPLPGGCHFLSHSDSLAAIRISSV